MTEKLSTSKEDMDSKEEKVKSFIFTYIYPG
jgi:hypothetical protein